MSKSPSRLGRPGSAGSKSPSLRKEPQSNRSCMLRIGERLMRAGSEGNLVQRPIPVQSHSQASSAVLWQGSKGQTQASAMEEKATEHTENNSSKDPGNSLSGVSSSFTSSVDSSSEHQLQTKPHTSSSLLCKPDSPCGSAPRSPSTLPRSYIAASHVSSRNSQLDSLAMQHSDVERKKEAFLDHLRQKYPHHAAILMGHQDHMREQARSPRPPESPPCAGGLGLAEQQDSLATETMSDGEVLPPTAPFTRGCKARASLPVGRSSGQTSDRAPGVLYLQYGEETKQVRMPAELSNQDSLRALFVTAFPHQLTMKMLQSPNMAIYIKGMSRNVYYNLEDVRNITSHSCLKVYHKDPAHVFNRHARPVKVEGRISKEVLYGSHSPIHSLSSSRRGTLHNLQGSMSPPMVRSMPSSPSRMVYGGGSTGGRTGMMDPDSATLPRERLSGAGRSSSLCSSSSAILERRDVKPDEDLCSSKSMALVVRSEGGTHFPDSYCSSLQDGGGGRVSIASSQCSAPRSLPADTVDAGLTGIPGGLQQYRASVKPLMGYGESMELQTCSLHRQKSRKYEESQLPPQGAKTPPSSPHRVNEVRMNDGQIIGGVGLVSPERMSPMRRSLQRDSNGAPVEIVNRSRGSGSSSSTSSVFVDSPLGQPERLFQGHVTASNAQSERMKAMEEQIASLAGLVHSALSMGSDVPRIKDAISESAERKLINNKPRGGSSEPHFPAATSDGFSPAPLVLRGPPCDSGLQQSLVLAKRNVCGLRLQLDQLRQLQLSNQESVSSMLRMAGQELVVLMCDQLAKSEEALFRQRNVIEEERICYLATEERILTQLHELEDYVNRLQSTSASNPGQLSVTLRDVEDGAVNLRRVGEALAVLKGEFPELQMKMRSVLRLEVEAVRFLKEEPHKMDSMLKRVKALTEALSCLRRCVSEITPIRSTQEPLKVEETDQGPLKTQSPQSSPKPQPRSSVRASLPTSSLSGSQDDVSVTGSASPIMARRRNTAAPVVQSSHHPPLTPTHGRDSPHVAKVSPCSREGSPALQRRLGTPQSPAQKSHAGQTTMKHTETHTESTERQTPEGSLSEETSAMNQSSTSQTSQPASLDASQLPPQNTSTDFDQVLQEAQSSLMNSIPDLNMSDTREDCRESASGQLTIDPSKSEQDSTLARTQQASAEHQSVLSYSQEDALPQLSEEVASTQSEPLATASLPAAPSPPPSAAPSASPSAPPSAPLSASTTASPSTEHSRRPQVEKPRRTSVEKDIKRSPDRAGKSPPPPPPRRFHGVSSGLTTGRSGEVVCTTRKEPIGAQNERESEKELPVPPQPKPPRQPPAVKPKPTVCAPAPLPSSISKLSTSNNSANRDEEEEEEESNKFMKELQVFQKYTVGDVGHKGVAELSASDIQSKELEPQVTTQLSNKNNLQGGHKQWKGDLRTSSASLLANSKLELGSSHHKSAPIMAIQEDIWLPRIEKAVGLEEQTKLRKDNIYPEKKSEAKKNMAQQMPSSKYATVDKVEASPSLTLQEVQTVQKNKEGPTPTPKKAEKVEVLKVTTLNKENDVPVTSYDQINNEVVEKVCSPTTAEKKVKFTAILTLQKENINATSVTIPEQIKEEVVKEETPEKKTNFMVVVTLQKENTPEDCLIGFEKEKALSFDQEYVASTPTLKLSPASTPSPSIKQQMQDEREVTGNQSQYTEEGSSLSPDVCDNEGPPPPPPTGKLNLRISRTRSPRGRTHEDLAEVSGSDIQAEAGVTTGEPTYIHNNQSFEDIDDSDKKPIIVILNEPMDIQSACKRLSTIFEYEEDLDGILSSENTVDEAETMQEEEKQDVRNICITELNTCLDLKDFKGRGLNSQNKQHQRPSSDNVSVSENQSLGTPDSLKKPEIKRKFKFKFPKNKLAALSQAIRTGTTKAGKKTLEVVVYEEEEVASYSGPGKETKKIQETKRFDLNNAKQFSFNESNARHSKSQSMVKDLCKSTFDSIDSLEESIKQLEISVDSMSAPGSPSSIVSSPPQSPDYSSDSTDRAQLKGKVERERERSLSKRPASQILKGPNPPQSKRAKPQPPQDSKKASTKKQTSSSSSSSSAPRSHTKSHHSSSSGSPEKKPKGHKQPSQADSRSSRAAGDSNHSVVALRASKIPALCHSSGKHSSASLSAPHCSDTADNFQNCSSFSSSASSSSASSASSSRKHSLLSSTSQCPSLPSSPSLRHRSRQQAFFCPLSSSSSVRTPVSVSPSDSPPCSPSPSLASFNLPATHKSFIPSLNLSRLLPSSSHDLLPSNANSSPVQHGPHSSSKHQHRFGLTSSSSTSSSSQHSHYSSSSYSSSSPSPSSTSSSLSPTSSSSSPPSPSSSLLPTMVSHGSRSAQRSASIPSAHGRGKKCTGGQADGVLRMAAASRDTP